MLMNIDWMEQISVGVHETPTSTVDVSGLGTIEKGLVGHVFRQIVFQFVL